MKLLDQPDKQKHFELVKKWTLKAPKPLRVPWGFIVFILASCKEVIDALGYGQAEFDDIKANWLGYKAGIRDYK